MVHLVIFALGTGGDVDPLVALGAELIRRGNRVSFLSNDYFEPIISASGCEFISVGTLAQYHKGNNVAAWERDNNTDTFEYYHAPTFEPAFHFIKHCANTPMLLLALSEQNGAVAAAEKFNVPFVKLILSPNVIFSAYTPPAPTSWVIPSPIPRFIVRFLLRRYRKVRFNRFHKSAHTRQYIATRKRLQCMPRYQKDSNAIVQIGFFPEWFGMRAPDWPSNLTLVGFPLQNRADYSARHLFDEWVSRLGAPIIFTTGTGVKDAQSLFREGRKICEQLGVPGVFVGVNNGAELLKGSTLCAHLNYLDFGYALPKALAIVHHGGIGTTAQAIKAGIPQLIRPLKYDQPDNADRIYKLGLGTYVMPEKFTAESVAPIVSNMLQKAKSSKALRLYSEDVSNSKAINLACDLIEAEVRKIKNTFS